MFEAVILAGGKGTRLKSVTGDLPKPMIDVGGQPFLYLLMKRLEQQGCSHIVLSLCYQADYIVKRVTEDKPVSIPVDFVIEKSAQGTGGALKLAASSVTSEAFVALNGDTLTDINFADIAGAYPQAGLVICGVEVDDVSRYGTLQLDSEHNVLGMREKGLTGKGTINSGIYVINKANMLGVAEDAFSFESDYVQKFKGTFKVFVHNGYFIDIGIPEDYYRACREIV